MKSVPEHTASGQNKIFFGWWIVFAGTIVMAFVSGIGFYGHGIFLDPLQEQYSWSKSIVTSAISLCFLVSGITGIFISRPIERYGPRPVIIIGSIIFGLALILLGYIKEVWHLYIVYFFLAIGWSSTSLLPLNTLITNWFIRRRGFAMSITMTGLSIGGIIIVPFATYIISRSGLKDAFLILGIIYCFVNIPLALIFFKQRPSDIGQYPDGMPLTDENAGENSQAVDISGQMQKWTRSRAMRTSAFWAIALTFFLVMIGQVAYLTHQISFLSLTLGRSRAAAAVSITAFASIIGRFLLGAVIDRTDKRYVAIGLFFCQITAIILLAYSSHVVVLYLGTFIFGLTMGSIIMVQSLLIGECFGLVSFPTVYSAVNMFSITGSALGPIAAGIIYDATNSYRIAFSVFAVATIIAACAVIFARPPKNAEEE